MGFGNTDPIDQRHKLRIRKLELALGSTLDAFERSTSLTQGERESFIRSGRSVLNANQKPPVEDRETVDTPMPSGAYC